MNDVTALTAAHCCRYDLAECAEGRLFAYDETRGDWTTEVGPIRALFLDGDHDVAALEVAGVPEPETHVAVSRRHGDELVGEDLYVVPSAIGGRREDSAGMARGYAEEVAYAYRSGDRTKRSQVLYSLGDEGWMTGGEPIFALHGHALIGIHHTGGVTPEMFGLTPDDTDGFTSLLAGTDGAAIAELLDEHGIEFDELEE